MMGKNEMATTAEEQQSSVWGGVFSVVRRRGLSFVFDFFWDDAWVFFVFDPQEKKKGKKGTSGNEIKEVLIYCFVKGK